MLVFILSLAAPGAAASRPAAAQTAALPVTTLPTMPSPTPDADALAAQVRLLAVNPLDLNALVRAGELAIKLDDDNAAAAFFARAERIDPRNARAKAGEGSLLVQSERPGEALRKFGEAESLGLDPQGFAADRGLAYDLIGEQERAQRDYRMALKAGADDETVRRYALSLGISGKRDRAFEQLDTLLRKSDRGAWRDRAFILAMSGDQAGAEKIAASMMPGNMGQGLEPFFERLAALPPADRAFAVHFGELRPTPARIADARMIPALQPLGPEPGAPVELASQTAPASDAKADRQARKKKRKTQPIETAAAAPPPLPQPPAYAAAAQPYTQQYSVPPVVAQPVPNVAAPAVHSAAPVVLASAAPQRAAVPLTSAPIVSAAPVTHAPTIAPPPKAAVAAIAVPQPAVRAPVSAPSAAQAGASPLPIAAATAASITPASGAAGAAPGNAAATAIATPVQPQAPIPTAAPPLQIATASPVVAAPAAAPASAAPAPGFSAASAAAPGAAAAIEAASAIPPASAPAPEAPAPDTGAAAAPLPKPSPVRSEDAIIANIIAGVPVPGSELGVAPVKAGPVKLAAIEPQASRPEPAKPAHSPEKSSTAEESRPEAKKEPVEKEDLGKKIAPSDVKEKSASGKKGVVADEASGMNKSSDVKTVKGKKTSGDEKSTNDNAKASDAASAKDKAGKSKPGKDKADDAKTSDTGKKSADKKADSKKSSDTRKKPDPAKADPSRIWVQVAGGATEDDLPKAWAGVKSKAADALKGRAGYTTPLRATNRVLTGPFKTNAEAQAFVNSLAKKGISGFTFTSDPGQKIDKLPAK